MSLCFLLFCLLELIFWSLLLKLPYGCRGCFCDKSQKCKISLNLPFDSLEMFICRESSPKFQMYIEQKANGTLTRENKNAIIEIQENEKKVHVQNFDP